MTHTAPTPLPFGLSGTTLTLCKRHCMHVALCTVEVVLGHEVCNKVLLWPQGTVS